MSQEIYDSTNTGIGHVVLCITYDLFADMLANCPKSSDRDNFIGILKQADKTEKLEEYLEPIEYLKEIPITNEFSRFMVFDRHGKCDVVSIWVTYGLAYDMIKNCSDSDNKKELIKAIKKMYMSDRLKECFSDLIKRHGQQ